ncbi:type II toxin-antitoxin system VapC family toxin [Oleomonas cavernae]|uniref:Type II toxin-antitoxin system VapC family toxin n=2 Tax=Oleomonas cavernae TaxID=2320859 RepID=A0A418WJ01_9PROT|nr:type II toxin-antitoxin system VapC family toxin [Oleomonas cavernae]
MIIYIRRNRPPQVQKRFHQLEAGAAAISVITYGELRYGAEKSTSRDSSLERLAALVSLLPVLALPDSAAETYGLLRAELERRGEMIGGNDLWIAAHALSEQFTLVTNNVREFQRIPGLAIENWI